MRKLKRSIARANMEKRGIKKINRQAFKGTPGKSFFAENWREYIN